MATSRRGDVNPRPSTGAGVEMTKKTGERRKFAPVDRDVHDIIDELLRAMPPPKNDQSPRKPVAEKTGVKRKRGRRKK
jgi:hypothetical protein